MNNPYNETQQKRLIELNEQIAYYAERSHPESILYAMNREMISQLVAEISEIRRSAFDSEKETRVANIKSQMLADINWSS